MTCYRPDRLDSTFDLPLEMANTRMAALRSETRRSRVAGDRPADHPPSGAVRRLRHGLGHRLIALGSALVADHRSRTLAR